MSQRKGCMPERILKSELLRSRKLIEFESLYLRRKFVYDRNRFYRGSAYCPQLSFVTVNIYPCIYTHTHVNRIALSIWVVRKQTNEVSCPKSQTNYIASQRCYFVQLCRCVKIGSVLVCAYAQVSCPSG